MTGSPPSRGAWIENGAAAAIGAAAVRVAPITGARIETSACPAAGANPLVVAPITGRVIETRMPGGSPGATFVAPITGARIETGSYADPSTTAACGSPHHGVRGLKHPDRVGCRYGSRSPPSRGRD